jgi:hypothetical protein
MMLEELMLRLLIGSQNLSLRAHRTQNSSKVNIANLSNTFIGIANIDKVSGKPELVIRLRFSRDVDGEIILFL